MICHKDLSTIQRLPTKKYLAFILLVYRENNICIQYVANMCGPCTRQASVMNDHGRQPQLDRYVYRCVCVCGLCGVHMVCVACVYVVCVWNVYVLIMYIVCVYFYSSRLLDVDVTTPEYNDAQTNILPPPPGRTSSGLTPAA